MEIEMKKILKFFNIAAFTNLLFAILIMMGCSVGSSAKKTEKVTITISGDEGLLNGKGVIFSVDKGTKWNAVKTNAAIKAVIFKEGYQFKGWRLGESNGKELENDYIFDENKNIFAVTLSLYEKVKYSQLNSYLEKLDASDGTFYIEVTDVKAEQLKGVRLPQQQPQASELGKILKNNAEKKCFFKLPETIAGLEDMSYCFFSCKNIIGVLYIPNGVKNMEGCFLLCSNLNKPPVLPQTIMNMSGCFAGCQNLLEAPAIPPNTNDMEGSFLKCESLEKAPAIPEGVINMAACFRGCINLSDVPSIPEKVENMGGCFFGCENLETVQAIPETVKVLEACFKGCIKLKGITLNCKYAAGKFNEAFAECPTLEVGSIKVKAEDLSRYKDNARIMGVGVDKFASQ